MTEKASANRRRRVPVPIRSAKQESSSPSSPNIEADRADPRLDKLLAEGMRRAVFLTRSRADARFDFWLRIARTVPRYFDVKPS